MRTRELAKLLLEGLTWLWRPKTHDYSVSDWGHTVNVMSVIDGGQRLKVYGFGKSIRRKHFLLLRSGDARSADGKTRYRVEAIKYMRDPTDQFFADLIFAPRSVA